MLHFGAIDWFGNEKTGGQYGFINSPDGKDYFFLGNQCVNFQPTSGSFVVFELAPSERHPGKHDAVNVRALAAIDDPTDIVNIMFLAPNYKLSARAVKSLAKQYGEVVSSKKWSGHQILKQFADTGTAVGV